MFGPSSILPTLRFGTFRYTSGTLPCVAELPDAGCVVELPVAVGGGVENEALAPVCPATCTTLGKDSKETMPVCHIISNANNGLVIIDMLTVIKLTR